jgi:hypothetical protein
MVVLPPSKTNAPLTTVPIAQVLATVPVKFRVVDWARVIVESSRFAENMALKNHKTLVINLFIEK